MFNQKRIKALGLTLLNLWVASIILVGLDSHSEVMAQGRFELDEIVKDIVAVQHRPAEVARLVQSVISAYPQQAATVAQAASKAVPPLAVLLTTAAVHTAPHRAVDIWQAVSRVVADQARKVQASADLALSLARNPDRSRVIIQSGLVTQPELTSAIVTASVTACDILGECSQTPVQSIVSSAIAVDQEAAGSIVEAAVRLLPAKSGLIIATADRALQKRQPPSSTPSAAETSSVLGATTRGAPAAPPVRVPGSTFR